MSLIEFSYLVAEFINKHFFEIMFYGLTAFFSLLIFGVVLKK